MDRPVARGLHGYVRTVVRCVVRLVAGPGSLGPGSMGTALATALLERGHATTVWNRAADNAKPLVDRGARQAATPEEAIEASPLVIACVLDCPALYGVLDPVAASLGGKTLVNLTSGSPEQANEAAAWARSHAVGHLDGAIMTTPPGVGSPEVLLLYSGSHPVFEAHRPALAALDDPPHLGTDPGLASLYDGACSPTPRPGAPRPTPCCGARAALRFPGFPGCPRPCTGSGTAPYGELRALDIKCASPLRLAPSDHAKDGAVQ